MVAFGMFGDVNMGGEHGSYQRDKDEDWRSFHLQRMSELAGHDGQRSERFLLTDHSARDPNLKKPFPRQKESFRDNYSAKSLTVGSINGLVLYVVYSLVLFRSLADGVMDDELEAS